MIGDDRPRGMANITWPTWLGLALLAGGFWAGLGDALGIFQ
ncbi:hypothetical protein J2X37_000588 [Croceicoccus sp. BE223]|nr:hypothetical protein [Croceicoccus sp. BE223]